MDKHYLILPPVLLVCFFLLGISNFSYAQTPDWNWAKGAGGNRQDMGSQIVIDSTGNLYTWGTFESGSIQLGSYTLINPSYTGQYLAKYDAAGNVVWAKTFPAELINIYNLCLDASGQLYMTGQYYGTLVLNGRQITYNDAGVKTFLAKLSTTGNALWLKNIGSTSYYSVTSGVSFVGFDDTHLLAFGNSFNDTIAGTATAKESWTCWIAKMDTSGAFSEPKLLAGLNLAVKAIRVDGNHQVYMGGTYSGGPFYSDAFRLDTIPKQGQREAFVAKFDERLNFLWSRMTYSANRDTRGAGFTNGDGMVVDLQNNVYLLADTQSDTLIIDPANPHTIARDSYFDIPWTDFFVKFDTDGNIIWEHLYKRNASSFTRAKILCSDKTGNLYYVGNYSGGQGVTFGSLNVTAEGNDNIFVAKFNTDGEPQWLQKNSKPGVAIVASAVEDGKGNIYMTGWLSLGNAGFGSSTVTLTTPIPGNPYASDMFISRLGSCAPVAPQLSPGGTKALCKNESLTATASGADHYLWTTNETTPSIDIADAGSYVVYGIDEAGCYALSNKLKVTQTVVNKQITMNSSTLTAVAQPANYQWVNCNEDYAPIDAQTAKSFTPQQSGSYAVIVTQNNCKDTSSCQSFFMTPVVSPQADQQLWVYPNPSTGVLQLNNTSQASGLASLYDLSGRKINEATVESGLNVLHYEELPVGVYILSVVLGDEQVVVKVVVRR